MVCKSIKFVDSDKELIEKIEKYRKEKNLSFIAAVRVLCTDALNVNHVLKNKEM